MLIPIIFARYLYNSMSTKELSEQEIQRRESLKKLREIELIHILRNYFRLLILPSHQNYEEGKEVCIAGRIK